jgi:hypothetical protein
MTERRQIIGFHYPREVLINRIIISRSKKIRRNSVRYYTFDVKNIRSRILCNESFKVSSAQYLMMNPQM